MAEHLLIPKRIARRLPWLKTLAWKLEVSLVRLLIRYLRAGSLQRSMTVASRLVGRLGPILPMWDKVGRNHRIAFPDRSNAEYKQLRHDTFTWLGTAVAELVCADKILVVYFCVVFHLNLGPDIQLTKLCLLPWVTGVTL